MIEILSSILASDLLSVGAEVQRMLDNGVDSLHVDIMDAHFVPNLSFGPAMVSALKKAFPAVHQDVHLMMDNPEKYLDTRTALDDTGAYQRAETECHIHRDGDIQFAERTLFTRGHRIFCRHKRTGDGEVSFCRL